jgi:hypothetical protein
MSLEAALHSRWAGDATLVALVPAAKFITGPALSSPAVPYVTLRRLPLRGVLRTSSHTVEDAAIQFHIWCDTLAVGVQIADAISARFERQSFTSDGTYVLRMRKLDQRQERFPDGIWELTVGYHVLYTGA